MRSSKFRFLLAVLLTPVFMIPAFAQADEPKDRKTTVVLAAFGTTDVEALESILNVEKRVKAAFPDYDVRLAFTSNIIRSIWHERGCDEAFKKENPGLDELYEIANPLTVLAQIQENGPRPVLVQSLHVTNGSEYGFLKNIIGQLSGIKALQESKNPFPYLALGESALGDGGQADLEKAAKALKPLVDMAKADGSALVLMGHGNEHLDVKSYRDFAACMNKVHGHPIFLGLVEGDPDFDVVLKDLKAAKVKSVFMAPFMLVAGDHAKNDMAGDEEDSWANQLKAEGFTVKTYVKGLGMIDSWADIYVDRLKALDAEYKKAGK